MYDHAMTPRCILNLHAADGIADLIVLERAIYISTHACRRIDVYPTRVIVFRLSEEWITCLHGRRQR